MSDDLENPCGYCSTKNSRVLYPTNDIFGNDFTINRCSNCHAFYLAPKPSEELLAQAYDESYYGEGEEKFKGLIEKVLDYFRRKRAALIAKHTGGKGRVLDLGCGNGQFLSFVKEKGDFEIFGIEPEGGSAKRAGRIPDIKLKAGILEEDDFEPESIDAITLFHVFEHLPNPVQTLEIIAKVIKEDGVLAMSFPNIDSFQSRFFKGKWLHLDPPRHLFFFTPKDFKALMKGYGFELIREKHFSFEYNPYGMAQSILNLMLKKREVLYESLKGNREYVKEYSKFSLLMQNLFFKLGFPIFLCLDAVDSLFRKGATVEFLFRKV